MNVPVEIIIHFPEKTQRVTGYMDRLDLNTDKVTVDWDQGGIKPSGVQTTFRLTGVVARLGGDEAKQAAADIKHAKRLARRQRARRG